MPCDIIYDHTNQSQYNSLLQEISHACTDHNVDQIILGGDFNTAFNRQASLHTISLTAYMDNDFLKNGYIHTSSNVDYTYCSKINNERSCLDHVWLSDNLLNIVCQYECKHEGDNLSHHDPITMSLDLPVDYINEHRKVKHNIRSLWYKTTEDDLLVYKNNLDKQLELMTIPHELLKYAVNNCNSQDSVI